MKLSNKLTGGYLVIALLAIVMSLFSLTYLHMIEVKYSEVTVETLPLIESLQDMRQAVLRLVSSTTEAAFLDRLAENNTDRALNRENELIDGAIRSYEDALLRFQKHIKRFPDRLDEFEAVRASGQLLIASSEEILSAGLHGVSDSGLFELKEIFEEREEQTLRDLEASLHHEEQEIAVRKKLVISTIHNSEHKLLIACGVLFVTALLLGYMTSKYISRPLGTLINAMKDVGRGDRTVKVNIKRSDEIGLLSRSFNNMTSDIRKYEDELNHNKEELRLKYNELEQEIAMRMNVEQELKNMAFYDHLTQLPNRASFVSNLDRLLRRSYFRKDYLFAVLFIDLDRFKIVNDSLGHTVGDKLLVEVARRMETCTRPTDRVARVENVESIARFGGDEFAIVLDDIKNIRSATLVADRIQHVLKKPFSLDGHEIFITASIGIAVSSTGYENAENILRDADAAMYRAKTRGRACAEIFDEEMHVKVKKLLKMESDLRAAVEESSFMVLYQPIVSARDFRITGAEALIRWRHPERGIVSPAEFIPVAEETGLITKIGEWILRAACAQNASWINAGYEAFPMKVNFSSRQFKEENLIETIRQILDETGMPVPLLDVEITESIAMADASLALLEQLAAMGIKTSVDDFGTGYSSLGSLTRLCINTIKIDRSFIKDISEDDNAQAIVKAIIAIAHSLKMDVVAEGVETEEQLTFLKHHGCDRIQGYFFSPPVAAEEFEKMLETERNGMSPFEAYAGTSA